MSHQKDTDYLALSARIRAMETRLLTPERMERMIEAKEHSEAVKVLAECGYAEPESLTGPGVERMLSAARQELLNDLRSAAPDKRVVEIFQLKYDYHNAKVLLKSKAKGAQPRRLLLAGGRYSADALALWFEREDLRDTSPSFRQAAEKAGAVLAETGDPQQSDLVLDRAYYQELTALAKDTGSQYLAGYAALAVDAANLRAVVRAQRMGKEGDFLAKVLLPGGKLSASALLSARGGGLAGLTAGGPMAAAGELGAKAAAGDGPLTAFEKACDDALTTYLSAARLAPFGEQVVIGYLYARESELTAIRTILSGRLAGLDGDTIRSRLRETYL